ARGWGSVFTTGLTIASLVYGPMLGAFLLGVLTKPANQTRRHGRHGAVACFYVADQLHDFHCLDLVRVDGYGNMFDSRLCPELARSYEGFCRWSGFVYISRWCLRFRRNSPLCKSRSAVNKEGRTVGAADAEQDDARRDDW